MKPKELLTIAGVALIIFININSRVSNNNSSPSVEVFKDYLVDVEKNKGPTVVILVSGDAYVNGKPASFVDAVPLEAAKRELRNAGYSILTLNTPCAIRCFDQYTELALLILEIEAEAVIYKGIHSDFGTDNLNNILKKANIPIYTFGSEVVLDYKLYTGPDNVGLAEAVAKGLADISTKGEKVVYIDTVAVFSQDKLDNGHQRILAVKNKLQELGLEEVETVYTFWNRARTFEEINRVLTNNKDVDYIIAPSIETALGASQAVEQLGYTDIKIIAMDFTEEGVRLLKDGRLYGLVSQELTEQGYSLANVIIDKTPIVKGTKKLFSSDIIITLDNLQEYEIRKGIYKW